MSMSNKRYDADFESACVGEGIQLIRQVSDLA